MNDQSFEIFYDGDCPICRREIDFLRRRDRQEKIVFRNLDKIDFEQEKLGKSYSQMMAEIHGRLPDGTWVVGVDVFRHVYRAIGWKSLVAVSRWPVICWILDWGYRVFARYRLALTGRCLEDCVPEHLR